MFKLSPDEIEKAKEAIEYHGYSSLLPPPPEWVVVLANWKNIKNAISHIDLDTHSPASTLRIYSPKSRFLVRPVSLLHPVDLIIYTALVLIIKDKLEEHRISTKKRCVFSYRADKGNTGILYKNGSYRLYREALEKKAKAANYQYVVSADIADFFPRINHHRLENVINTCVQEPRHLDVARVLVKKFLNQMMKKNSYGIPVGPYASRLLGEAILIDADAFLLGLKVNFIRWVDDYAIFCKSRDMGEEIIHRLGAYLYDNHGLTLQPSKTKIVERDEFWKQIHKKPQYEKDGPWAELISMVSEFNMYAEEMDEEELTKIYVNLEALDLVEQLGDLLSVDSYDIETDKVRLVLRSISAISSHQPDLWDGALGAVLANLKKIPHLGDALGRFLLSNQNMTNDDRKKISKAITAALNKGYTPEFLAIWLLHVLSQAGGIKDVAILQSLYEHNSSSAVRRATAIAIGDVGTRAQAVRVKMDYEQAPPLLKSAILFASRKLAAEERKFWLATVQPAGPVEKAI